VITGLLDVMDQYVADGKSWTMRQLKQRMLGVKQLGCPLEDFWNVHDAHDEIAEASDAIAQCICEILSSIQKKTAQLVASIESGEATGIADVAKLKIESNLVLYLLRKHVRSTWHVFEKILIVHKHSSQESCIQLCLIPSSLKAISYPEVSYRWFQGVHS
jgi:hypothetical protein